MEALNFIIQTLNYYGFSITLLIIIIIFIIVIIKITIEKSIENVINSKTKINVEKIIDNLSRQRIAYNIIIEKEFHFYELVQEYMSSYVTIIQDITYTIEEHANISNKDDKKKIIKSCKEYFLEFLENIPKIKKDLIMYGNYIDKRIETEVASFVKMTQDSTETIYQIYKKRKKTKADIEQIKEIEKACLLQISLIMTLIKTRYENLSQNNNKL